jgi:hypothetical protein
MSFCQWSVKVLGNGNPYDVRLFRFVVIVFGSNVRRLPVKGRTSTNLKRMICLRRNISPVAMCMLAFHRPAQGSAQPATHCELDMHYAYCI